MKMGSSSETTTPPPIPKLSLFSSMAATPPINSSAVSIPFHWEEAPGKPRPHPHPHPTQSGRLELQLPPRLLVSSDCCRGILASPTTVLDGPDDSVVPGPKTRGSPTLSFRGPASLSRRVLSGSGRWKSFRKSNAHVSAAAGTFDPPPDDGATSVKITRVIRRRASFFNLAAGTNVLANIYEGLKQVVPWRRVHEKKRRKGAI